MSEKGYAIGRFELALSYLCGMDRNIERAIEWCKKAVDIASYDEEEKIARILIAQDGIATDDKAKMESVIMDEVVSHDMNDSATAEEVDAFKKHWLDSVIGDSAAQCKLARMYYYEKSGVIEDVDRAVRWFRSASEHGNVYALLRLGECYAKGFGVDKEAEEAKACGERALKLAEHGTADDQYEIAMFYLNGWKPFEENNDEAFKWCLKAAEQGHGGAQNMVGRCYEEAWGCEKDREKAFEWYQKAADKGDAAPMCNLGRIYDKEKKDLEKAFEWYQKAADNGNAVAMNNLGWLYENEKKDFRRAIECYQTAADKGNERSMFHVGRCYEKGIGATADIQKAREWYKKAAGKGEKDATAALERLG